jgi:hypothetical protein
MLSFQEDMAMERDFEQKQPRGSEPSKKKPYRRPEILYREPLEAMAALCTPSPPAKANLGMCQQGPISS